MCTTRGSLAATLIVFSAACGGGAADGSGSSDGGGSQEATCPITAPVASPTFRGDVLPVLRLNCGANSAISCHGTPSPRGHVSYSPTLAAHDVWSQLVGVAPANAPTGAGWMRIAPSDAAHSWLLEKVTKDDPGGAGQAYGNRMPLGLPDLCDATVETIRNWVEQGAKDD